MPSDYLFWLESVPSGLRWFCRGCNGVVTGLGELDRDEAERQMQHDPGCTRNDD